MDGQTIVGLTDPDRWTIRWFRNFVIKQHRETAWRGSGGRIPLGDRPGRAVRFVLTAVSQRLLFNRGLGGLSGEVTLHLFT